MPAPGNSINRYPRGFLALLDGKTDGRTPQRWGDELLTTLDMSPLYLNSFKEAVQGVTSAFATPTFAGAGTGTVNLAPPDDEIWVVDSFDVSSTAALGAGITIEGHPAVSWGNGTTPIKAGSANSFSPGEIAHWGGTNFPLGLIALPRWHFGFMATNVVVGGVPLTATVWVTKLKI